MGEDERVGENGRECEKEVEREEDGREDCEREGDESGLVGVLLAVLVPNKSIITINNCNKRCIVYLAGRWLWLRGNMGNLYLLKINPSFLPLSSFPFISFFFFFFFFLIFFFLLASSFSFSNTFAMLAREAEQTLTASLK